MSVPADNKVQRPALGTACFHCCIKTWIREASRFWFPPKLGQSLLTLNNYFYYKSVWRRGRKVGRSRCAVERFSWFPALEWSWRIVTWSRPSSSEYPLSLSLPHVDIYVRGVNTLLFCQSSYCTIIYYYIHFTMLFDAMCIIFQTYSIYSLLIFLLVNCVINLSNFSQHWRF